MTDYRAVQLPAASTEPQLIVLPLQDPGPGEALIKVEACGLCGSDLFLQDGGFGVPFPVIPGHEAAGVVVSLGPGAPGPPPGTRVALHYIHKQAGEPDPVPAYPNLGPAVRRMGVDVAGALAEYVVRPVTTLIEPEAPIAPEALAVLTDAVSTPYHALVGVAGLRAGERVGVIGIGGIGSNAVQVAAALGADVTAVGRSARSLDLAAELGAHRVVASDEATRPGGPRWMDGGLDVVVVATDAPGSVELAVSLCGPRARVVLVGATHRGLEVSTVELIWREIALLGSRGFTADDIRAVQRLYARRLVTVDHLLTDIRPLSESALAFRDLRMGGSTRIVMQP